MFAKVLRKSDGLRYVTNVQDVDASKIETHFTVTLREKGYSNVPSDVNEVRGRLLTIKSADEEEDLLIFCDDVVYLCSETGQTVDRIMCKGQ